LAHVLEQTPSQQSCPVAAQSVEAVHALGHVSYAGFRQRPGAVTDGSMLCTDVQQTSPLLVWQSELVVQLFGQSFDGTQIPWL
jgi:hypothetical protein